MTISTVRLLYISSLELLVVMNWMGSASPPCFDLRVGHHVLNNRVCANNMIIQILISQICEVVILKIVQ